MATSTRTASKCLPWIPLGIWWAVMLYFSSVPNPYALIEDLAWTPIDAVSHLVGFGVFGFLLTMALGGLLGRSGTTVGWAVMACALYGVVDELHQIPIAGRGCTWQDMLTNAAGGLVGVVLMAAWWRVTRSRRTTDRAD